MTRENCSRALPNAIDNQIGIRSWPRPTATSTRYKTFIVVMYRPPSGDFDLFLNLCNGLLNKLYSTDKSIIIGGDFNINFLNHSTNLSLFKDLLLCFDLHTTINSPTRVTSFSSTCLDNFLITSNMDNFKTCVADLYLPDHNSQILSIQIQKNNKNENKCVYCRKHSSVS